jgi:hypothetical protein
VSKVKWHTLEHHGMTFPPAFKELPKDVNAKVRATGQIIELN